MKNLIIIVTLIFVILGCTPETSIEQDMQMLQETYPNSVVYRIDIMDYIVCDSSNVYHISVTSDGKISTKIKIK